MCRGAWQATVRGVAKSRTQPSHWHLHFLWIYTLTYFMADQRFECLETGCEFWFLPALPHCQCSGLLSLSFSLPGAGKVDEATKVWESLAVEEGKWVPCYLCLRDKTLKPFAVWDSSMQSRPLSHACSFLLPRLCESNIKECFFGWQVGAEKGNRWRRESDSQSPKCHMHQYNLFRQVFIWVFSILSNSVSFSEDICLSWIKSLNGLIKST